jgi:glycosyltransferase involved in cell wall biosynthesis
MTNETPLVSLSVPVYNGENYLAEALDSLLAQTFTDFEIIITDNASTDGTEAIGRAYAERDPRVRYVRNAENLGAAGNFNYGFSLARGRYFKWAAHDDIIAPDFLQKCVDVLDAEPDVVLAYPLVTFIGNEGESLARFDQRLAVGQVAASDRLAHYLRYQGQGRELDERGVPLEKKQTRWPQFSPVFGLMRTDILRKTIQIGDFISSDRVLLAELALYGAFYEIMEYLLFIRFHMGMSVKYRTNTGYAAWFSPRNLGKFVIPNVKLAQEYARAINRVPLTARDRLRSHLAMWRYIILRDGVGDFVQFLRKRVFWRIIGAVRDRGKQQAAASPQQES